MLAREPPGADAEAPAHPVAWAGFSSEDRFRRIAGMTGEWIWGAGQEAATSSATPPSRASSGRVTNNNNNWGLQSDVAVFTIPNPHGRDWALGAVRPGDRAGVHRAAGARR
jgi:hypothetical protein